MFQARLADAATAIEAQFQTIWKAQAQSTLIDAMAHACNGGKRLRGFLVFESAQLHNLDPATAIFPATGIEAMHAYSLVHDDLPCMDDDDLRRGLPTVHKKWDDATAVLAGDALQALAFELAGHGAASPSADVRIDLVQSLARASGMTGMVGGQAKDIAAETALAPLSLDAITALQRGKTGALIEWAAVAGARMAGADIAPLQNYANALGLAFQIADDILDVTGQAETVGKATGKDADAGKATFVSHLGLAGATKRANELAELACDSLAIYGAQAQTLRDTARFVIDREH